MSALKDRIKEDMIVAMKAKDKEKLGVIRMLQAGLKQVEIDQKIQLDDTAVLRVVEKMIKQRHESARQFELGNRPELAAKEKREIGILEDYMPTQLSQDEVDSLIEKAIQNSNATSMKDMGKVMGTLKAQLQGRTNMAGVSAKIKDRLS
jgi:uncharacterized protein